MIADRRSRTIQLSEYPVLKELVVGEVIGSGNFGEGMQILYNIIDSVKGNMDWVFYHVETKYKAPKLR